MPSIQINQNIPPAAIVMEDSDNLLVDLRISGPIDAWEPSEFRYLVWSKHEDQLFGVAREVDALLELSFVVPHLGKYRLELADLLPKAASAWHDYCRSMEM